MYLFVSDKKKKLYPLFGLLNTISTIFIELLTPHFYLYIKHDSPYKHLSDHLKVVKQGNKYKTRICLQNVTFLSLKKKEFCFQELSFLLLIFWFGFMQSKKSKEMLGDFLLLLLIRK